MGAGGSPETAEGLLLYSLWRQITIDFFSPLFFNFGLISTGSFHETKVFVANLSLNFKMSKKGDVKDAAEDVAKDVGEEVKDAAVEEASDALCDAICGCLEDQ